MKCDLSTIFLQDVKGMKRHGKFYEQYLSGERIVDSFFEKQNFDADSIVRDNVTRYDNNQSNDAKNCEAPLLDPPHIRP